MSGPLQTMARRGEAGRITMTRLNVNDAQCTALFASGLQRSDAPTGEAMAEAVSRTVRQYGVRGCAGLMAQEFGDHPEAAMERMRWIRQLIAEMPARPARPAAGIARRAA
jgi:L-fucose isomerase-like protein